MAERPIDINLVASATASDKLTEADRASSLLAKTNKLREVYERGVVGDRLNVELPADKCGQWVPSDAMSIHRMESLGYQIDKEYAPKRRLHDKGDGASYVGDVVYMIAERETRDIIEVIKRERYERLNNPRKQKEESDFANQNKSLTSAGIGTLNESKAHEIRKSEIEQVLKTTT